tara:strand:+ start:4868 stop:5758 length:891 start_codon:yes stop_codon:yes gene_type:complete
MPWNWLVPTAIGLFQGNENKKAAKKAKSDEDAFLEKKWAEYDMPAYEMSGDKLRADRDFIIEGINLKVANEKKFAAFKDQNNLRAYQQQLKIRTFQHEQQERLYRKSEYLYAQSVQQAQEQAAIQMQEVKQKFAFENEDRIIESIQKKGELAVTSQTGRNAVKAAQSEMYDQGRQITIMTESLISADRNTRMGLRDFLRKADAQRMLRPEAPPEPLKPLETPLHDYQLPRALQPFDFGPEPIKGVSFQQVPSSLSVLAGAASAGFSAYAAQTPGTNTTTNYGGSYIHQTPSPTWGV